MKRDGETQRNKEAFKNIENVYQMKKTVLWRACKNFWNRSIENYSNAWIKYEE